MKLGEKVSFIFDWPSLADVRKQKRFNAFRREGNTVFHSCLDRAFRKCFLCVRLFSKGKMFPILDSSMLLVQLSRNWRATSSVENTELSKLSDQKNEREVEIGVLSCPFAII